MATTWTEENLGDSIWGYEGPLIYLVTEGDRDFIMTECRADYIVTCKPGEWTEIILGSATWSDVTTDSTTWNDVSVPTTSWTEENIE